MSKSTSQHKNISEAERQHMIEEAAYFRAEERGFDPTEAMQDWLEAEKIVDKYLEKHKTHIMEH